MDPNETLRRILRTAELINIRGTKFADPEDISDLAESVYYLDEWLAKGGALPKRWDVYNGDIDA